jgi:hypothetical protein
MHHLCLRQLYSADREAGYDIRQGIARRITTEAEYLRLDFQCP